MKYIALILGTFFCLSTTFAQNGKYDVRLKEYQIDEINNFYYVDIEIKSASLSDTFRLTHQNYRFTYDQLVIDNPIIDQELELSGSLQTPYGNSSFTQHTLKGSKDSIISYGVEFQASTDPYFLTHDQWTTVGRLRFDIIDLQGDPNLIWKSPSDFPATVILRREGLYYPQVENNKSLSGTCFPTACTHAGEDQSACQDKASIILEGTGIGEWSNFGPMTLSDINTPNATVTNLSTGTWDFIWTVDGVPDTVIIVIDDDCVFPGDTNKDAVVNNHDILNIGLGVGIPGIPRPNASLDWIGQMADDWTESTPISNINFKHADTDGNGNVDAVDTTALIQNWGESYTNANFQQATGTVPFYTLPATAAPGETIDLPIILGDSNNPLADVYGLAFTMTYDTAMVVPETAVALFATSWLGDITTNLIAVQKNFADQGQIDIGLTRIDGMNTSGFGEIGILRITIKDDVWLDFADEKYLPINIENVRLQAFDETETLTDPQISYVTIPEPLSTDDLAYELPSLSPNPARGQLTINNLERVDAINIFNALGQMVYQARPKNEQLLVETSTWPTGVYMVMMEVEGKQYNTRLLVQH